jgi:hypothetical protein
MVVPPVKYWMADPVMHVRVAAMTPVDIVQVEKRRGLVRAVPPDWVNPPVVQAVQEVAATFMKLPD